MRHVLNNLKNQCPADQQIFYANSTTALAATVQNWQVWRKPRNSTMVHIFCMGGGGGGGAGFSAATSGASPGGGGGGGGGASVCIIPSMMLPDQLYVFTGAGGSGGVAGSGTAGIQSVVSVGPIQLGTNSLQVVALGTGGNLGAVPANGTTAGVGGTAVGAPSASTMPYGLRGACTFFAGTAGRDGSTNVAATAVSISATTIFNTGGGGGGGLPSTATGTSGSSILGTSTFSLPGDIRPPATSSIYCQGGIGQAGASAITVNGEHGISFLNGMLMSIGGGGGAATPAGIATLAGNGGIGGYGSGGGAGGGCFTGGTRSVGGRGGDGLVIITWW